MAKKLKITLEAEVEMPDDSEILSLETATQGEMQFLSVAGKWLAPSLQWEAYAQDMFGDDSYSRVSAEENEWLHDRVDWVELSWRIAEIGTSATPVPKFPE